MSVCQVITRFGYVINLNKKGKFRVIQYIKLTIEQKKSRYNNMKARCGRDYQNRNPRYYGTYLCEEWLNDKGSSFFAWLDDNYYEIDNEQMDIDKDILQYGNRLYHPELCLIVPHSINAFFEKIEIGKTSIKFDKKIEKYSVQIFDRNQKIYVNNIDSYNDAVDIFCDIKQGILINKAKSLKERVPDKVYQALMNTDIKAINAKHYELVSGEES